MMLMIDTSYLLLSPENRLLYYTAVFALLVILAERNMSELIGRFNCISTETSKRLLMIGIAALVIRISLAPYKAIINVSVWAHLRGAIMISEDHVLNLSQDTRAYELLISPIYTLTNDIIFSWHALDIGMAILSIIAIFYLSYALFKDELAALLSASILALLPWHIFFSGTCAREIVASFFIIISMIFILEYGKRKDPKLLLLSEIAVLFTALVRKEEIILFLMIILWSVYNHSLDKRWFIYSIPSFFLIVPFIVDMLGENFYVSQISAAYILPNIRLILGLFSYNFLLVILFVGPAMLFIHKKEIFRNHKKEVEFLVIWMLVISVPFLIHKDLNSRYYIFFALPYILFVAFSLSRLASILKGKQMLAFIGAFFLLLSVYSVDIYTECSNDSGCMYFTPEQLRWQDDYLADIYLEFNSTSSYSTLVFIDPQLKNAFQSLFRDYPAINVHTAWSDDEYDTGGYLKYMDLGSEFHDNYNLYLIIFDDEYSDYCNLDFHFDAFCEKQSSYELVLYQDRDKYDIYLMTPIDMSDDGDDDIF